MTIETVFPTAETQQPSLNWERPTGEPWGTGICLSGGGIRAAMFSLGVLQRLQEREDLVFGERSADILSVVSGGSYMAGSHALGALQRTLDANAYTGSDPLAKGSPEEAHILGHGEYLWKNPVRYGMFVLLNLVSVFSLFATLAFILACLGAIQKGIIEKDQTPEWITDGYAWLDRLPIWIPILGFLIAYFLMFVVYARGDRFPIRPAGTLALLAIAAIFTYPLLEYGNDNLTWDSRGFFRSLVAAILVVLAVLTVVGYLLRNREGGKLPVVFNWLALIAPRVLAFILIGWIAVWLYPGLPEAIGRADLSGLDIPERLVVVAVLVTALLGSLSSSLHREYRKRLMSCYSVVRGSDDTALQIDSSLVSELAPLDGDGPDSFPRLLISATANVRPPGEPGWWKSPRRIFDRLTKSTTFLPYVLSYDQCGSPGHDGTVMETGKLEHAQVRTGLLRSGMEPLLSLYSAIACTGAAISPNMGYKTEATLRPFIAALNFRLGRWFPNPFNARASKQLDELQSPGELKFHSAFGDENDELMTEMLGLYGPRMYISDGGHYDNLGLLALLQARCKTIWCVDASPSATGETAELRRVIDLATEAGIVDTVTIDTSRFGTEPGVLFATTHRTGTITYRSSDPDASPQHATLILLRLGLTDASAQPLRELAQRNRTSFLQKRATMLGLFAGMIVPLATFILRIFLDIPAWALNAAALVLVVAVVGLWFWQLRPTNSALAGYFPHHSTFGKIGFNTVETTAYRDTGRAVVDRCLDSMPVGV